MLIFYFVIFVVLITILICGVVELRKNSTWVKWYDVEHRVYKVTYWETLGTYSYKIERIYRAKRNFFDFDWRKEVYRQTCTSTLTLIEESQTKVKELANDEALTPTTIREKLDKLTTSRWECL